MQTIVRIFHRKPGLVTVDVVFKRSTALHFGGGSRNDYTAVYKREVNLPAQLPLHYLSREP